MDRRFSHIYENALICLCMCELLFHSGTANPAFLLLIDELRAGRTLVPFVLAEILRGLNLWLNGVTRPFSGSGAILQVWSHLFYICPVFLPQIFWD